jgi:hypothetical protein
VWCTLLWRIVAVTYLKPSTTNVDVILTIITFLLTSMGIWEDHTIRMFLSDFFTFLFFLLG